MDAFSMIAERKIREALEAGELDNLPGCGEPLQIEDDSWVPEDLRMAYRILKNAGCLPPELELQKDIMNLQDLLDTIDDDEERLKLIKKLQFTIIRLGEIRKRPVSIEKFPDYERRLYMKILDRPSGKSRT